MLESTTYPGTTEEEVLPLMQQSGLRCADHFLAFSPEPEDPDTRTPAVHHPKAVGGVNAESTAVAAALYSAALEKLVPVSGARVPESCKLLENVFRSVNSRGSTS